MPLLLGRAPAWWSCPGVNPPDRPPRILGTPPLQQCTYASERLPRLGLGLVRLGSYEASSKGTMEATIAPY